MLETRIPNVPHVYRLVEIGSDGKQKDTGKFRVRRRIKVGLRWTMRTRTFDNFDEAKLYAKSKQSTEIETEVASGNFQNEFDRYISHLRNRKLARGTIQGYLIRARHFEFFHPFKVKEITPKVVDAWLNLLCEPEYIARQQSSRVSYEHEFVTLGGFFKFFRNHRDDTFMSPILDRHSEIAYARSRSDEHEVRYLNLVQEVQFLTELNFKPVIQDLAIFQLQTGARVGEAAAVEYGAIDFIRREARIAQHLDWERTKDASILVTPGTKGGPPRTVPIPDEALRMLDRRRRNAMNKIVFPGRSESWLTYREIQSAYDRAFKKLGFPHRGTHVLRHTFAVRFLDRTKDIHSVKRILGHKNLKDTEVYANYSDESVRQSVALFNRGKSLDSEGFVSESVSD